MNPYQKKRWDPRIKECDSELDDKMLNSTEKRKTSIRSIGGTQSKARDRSVGGPRQEHGGNVEKMAQESNRRTGLEKL